MDNISGVAFGTFLVHLILVLGLFVRVIMRRRPVGVLLAWMAIILSVPVLGSLIYLVVGESRISGKYLKRGRLIHRRYADWKQALCARANVDWTDVSPQAVALQNQARTVTGFPALQGNRLELLQDADEVFRSLIGAIAQSRRSCHLEFYIWYAGGLADELLETVIGAARRGVVCRLLLDALGSKPFLHSAAVNRLRQAGVELAVALPVGLFTTLVTRADLRNHRKLAVIDGEVAWTGSQNLVDPRFFKQDEGVGQWVDAMFRIEGPVVEALGGMFINDWEVATGAGLDSLEVTDVRPIPGPVPGVVPVQVIPSGPIPQPLAILQMILGAFYAAQRELIVTTPYFVPDESVLTALLSAAHRGVHVTLLLPATNDSWLVDLAGKAVFADLLEAGVQIAAFKGGLLHTKSITVDGEFALFGSVNMDMRSLWLNFELSLLIYDRESTALIRRMQQGYLDDSDPVSLNEWRQRSFKQRFLENAVHLLAPLL
jgi:cardiolipin synthase A/B